MIVNNKSGSIIFFSFDENEGLSEHIAPFDVVATILDGVSKVWIQGETYQMKKAILSFFRRMSRMHSISLIIYSTR